MVARFACGDLNDSNQFTGCSAGLRSNNGCAREYVLDASVLSFESLKHPGLRDRFRSPKTLRDLRSARLQSQTLDRSEGDLFTGCRGVIDSERRKQPRRTLAVGSQV